MRTCGAFIVKDDLCVVWAKIVGFMDNKPWWKLEHGKQLVKYNDTSHYLTEISNPITPRYIIEMKYTDMC